MDHRKLEDVGLEPEQRAATSAQLDLAAYFDSRPEIGFAKMFFNLALEPQNPFKRDARRIFRKGFVIAAVFSALFAAWCVWFNVIR